MHEHVVTTDDTQKNSLIIHTTHTNNTVQSRKSGCMEYIEKIYIILFETHQELTNGSALPLMRTQLRNVYDNRLFQGYKFLRTIYISGNWLFICHLIC